MKGNLQFTSSITFTPLSRTAQSDSHLDKEKWKGLLLQQIELNILSSQTHLIPDKSGLLELVKALALFITGFALYCKGLVPFRVPPKASSL